MNARKLFSALILVPLLAAPLAFADTKEKKEEKKEEPKTKPQEKNLNISTSSGPRSCSATSGDKKQSCSVSCKENEDASCSNTDTEATCSCN